MEKNIKVSVCVITYNHEAYIEKCLLSILEQDVDFEFEILLGDDCSSDNTRKVINEIDKKYPGKIRKFFHSKNIGVCDNYKAVHFAAQGEYIAHCDGDDYWLQGKLREQVSFLDENQDFVQCWTCAKTVDENNVDIGVFPSKLGIQLYPSVVMAKDIVQSYALVGQHSTQLYRRSAQKNIEISEFLDYLVAFNISLSGKTYYMKKILSAYRVSGGESVTRNSNSKKAAVDLLGTHLVDIAEQHPIYAADAKANIYVRYFFSYLKRHNLTLIKNSLKELRQIKVSISSIFISCFWFLVQKIK